MFSSHLVSSFAYAVSGAELETIPLVSPAITFVEENVFRIKVVIDLEQVNLSVPQSVLLCNGDNKVAVVKIKMS